jgi:hypothetical protein
MGEKKNAYKILVGKPQGKRPLERPVERPCEHGNKPSGSTKCWKILEKLHNWQLLKKGSAPWS